MTLIYVLSGLLLVALLTASKIESKPLAWFSKPTLSVMFIVVAVLHSEDWSMFSVLMVTGFVCCFFGDVFLIPQNRKMFLAGLVSFLTGHLFYIAAFVQVAALDMLVVVSLVVLLVIDGAVYYWLKDYIEEMKTAVVSYMLVISLMVLAASSVMINTDYSAMGRVLLLTGAVAFFVSDLFVVRDKFVKEGFVNRLFGLPLYYGGQFLLAISLGQFS